MADYLQFLEDFEQRRRQGEQTGLAATSTLTEGIDPDTVSRAHSTARFLGVPPAAVEAMPQEYEREARQRRLELDTQDAPTLRRRYTDADFAKLASDDSGVLSGVESVVRRMLSPRREARPVAIDPVMSSVQFSDTVRRMVERNPALDVDTARALVLQRTQIVNGPTIGPSRGPAPSVGSVVGGLFNAERLRATSAGLGIGIADALGLDPEPEIRKYQRSRARADLLTPEFESSTAQGIYGGLQSVVDQTPGIALSVITGNPTPAMALLGAQSYGEAYGKYRERGGTAGEAALGAGLEAGAEVATELLPMSFLVKRLGRVGAGEFLTGLLAREVPGEQVATLVQDAVDTAIANPDKTWGEYLAERPEAAYRTLVATLTQGGVMASANVAARRFAGPQQDAQRAEESVQAVEQLAQLQAASKLAQRDPESFVDLVRDMTAEGEAPAEFFVDAQQLAGTLNQSGVDLEKLRAAAPQIVRQLENPTPGADVRAPVEELVALGPELTQPLMDHLRAAPEAMSRAEAQQFMSQQGERIQAEVQQALAEQQVAEGFRQQVEQATAHFEQELATAGRFRPEVNKAYASLLGNFYAVEAQRAGVPLEQFMQRYALQVRSQAPGGGQRLEQGGALADVLATWSDAGIRHAVHEKNGTITVSQIIVPEDRRGAGTGTAAMQALVDYADRTGQHVVLSPSGDFGGDKKRLVQFYKRFGFVENKGRNRAFSTSETMYRQTPGRVLEQGERGSLSFAADITTAPSVLALLENADLSTFIHETGHFALEVQADLAARIQTRISAGEEATPGEQQIVADFGRILEWFGIQGDAQRTPLDTWVAMSLEERREHHEQWARGFERYMMEGKAPSLELQPLFARFRAWLVRVYQTLTGLNVQLSDDVRQVMGRMLASDAAIAEAQAARDMGPMFQTPEQAGMTLEEYAQYQRLAEGATAEASRELDARLMRDMKWLSRARDKALKEAQASADAARAEVEREVRAEVMAEPIYRAWSFLTGKQQRLAPGTVAPENIDGTLQSGRLRTSLVKAMDPAIWERLTKLGMTSEEWGMDPDIVAELFGFASGQQLVQTLMITPPPATVIGELTDFRTLQRHGDIASPEALNRAADEAVHNELRARVIANELKALARANRVTETGDDIYRKRDVVNVMARAAEGYAAQVVARQQIRHLRPQQYAAAEARSAKLAAQALGKSTQEAAMHKRNQLINNYATKAAYEAQAEIRKGVEFFRRVIRGNRDEIAKQRDWDMVQAARAILAEYGVGSKGEAAQTYLQAIEQYDPQTARVLRDKVDTLTVNAKPLNQLTVEEFRGLFDELQGLWYLAKRSRQVEIDGKLMDIEAAKAPLVERMEAIGIPDRVPGEGRAVTEAERRVARLRSAAAALRRVESWVGAKDGSTPGPFRRFIWQPVKEAADRYRADRGKFLRRYRDLLKGLDLGRERIHAPEIDYTFGYSRGGSGKAEVLHALLHTGNASNKRKLLLGRGWATENPDGTLNTTRWDAFVQRMIDQGVLTKADFDFAQGVWDLLEEMKPAAQKAHRDVFGRYFDEVTAEPFTNALGTWRGGYVPAMTDAEVVKDAATRKLQEDENQTLVYAFPATNRGFTKSRVEYNAPLLLDLRTLSSHIDKVLLFSHLEQPIREVRRILTSKSVSMPLHRIDPAAFDGILTPWMNRAARQQVEAAVPGDNGLMRFFSRLRSRTGMAAMFANVVNTAQQVTGLSIAAVRVRPRYLRSALVDYVKAPRQFTRGVADASTYMATRMDNEVAQMNDAIDEILLNPSLYERGKQWAAKHAYFMQAAVDNVIGPVVWTGAYNQALEGGATELEARRAADSAVRETQGSTLPEDVSRIETGNAFVRMFTQFAGYFNMQANLLGTEFATVMHEQGLRKGMGRGIYVFTFGFLVPAMVSEIIVQAARGGPEDEDGDGVLDEWLMSVLVLGNLRAGLAMAPGVGQAVNAMINTANSKPYDDRISTSPAVSMVEAAVRAPVGVYKAVAEDGNQRRAVRDLATLITLTTGLPATAVARPLGYAADVSQGKVEPTGPVDAVRGAVTGVASPESKR
jgi:GNAT superfamily N-acetyltransferase